MKKLLPAVFTVICLFAANTLAQTPAPPENKPVIVLDIQLVDVEAQTQEEIERLAKNRSRLNQAITEGKAAIAASVQLQSLSGEPNTIRIGQRIPIRHNSANNQARYESPGVHIIATAQLKNSQLIEVKLSLEFSGVLGESASPTHVQRSMNNVFRAKPGEITLLYGVALNQVQLEAGATASRKHGNFFVTVVARVEN